MKSRVMKGRSDWMLHPQAFLQIQQRWGPLVVDLFASRLTEVLQLEIRPRGRGFQSGLDTTPAEDVCQPPVEFNGESPEQTLPAEDHASPGCPSTEETTMVPDVVGVPGGLSNPTPSEGRSDHPDTPRECLGDDAPTSCLAYLTRCY